MSEPMAPAAETHDAALGPESPLEPAYSLLSEPWLSVRWLSGSTGSVGLRELFARSHEIAALAETSPPAWVALHRMLLAITHRALTLQLGRWTDADRARWFRHGLPAEAFTAYFDRWQDRFWLFHPAQPFMQVAALACAPQTQVPKPWTQVPKPWTQVALANAAGNNPVVFDHSIDAAPRATSPAQVLCAMLGYLQFVPGGPVKVLHGHDKKGPLFDSAVILPVGATLAQTLALSLHPSATSDAMQQQDRPAWERDPPTLEHLIADAALAEGTNDLYTRLTRAVLLLREPAVGDVTHLRFSEGLGLLEDDMSADPMHSCKQSDDKSVRLRFADGRAGWRDLPALLPVAPGTTWRPAAVLSWSRNLLNAGGAFDDEVQVVVAGMAATQGKMLQVRSEHFRLPPGVMSAADTAAALREQLQRAEELHLALKQLARRVVAMATPNSSSKETQNHARDTVDAGPLAATFFVHAERGLAALLQALGHGDTDAAHTAWSAVLLGAAAAAWAAVGDLLGQSADALRARALNEGRFHALIHPLRPAATTPAATAHEETPA